MKIRRLVRNKINLKYLRTSYQLPLLKTVLIVDDTKEFSSQFGSQRSAEHNREGERVT